MVEFKWGIDRGVSSVNVKDGSPLFALSSSLPGRQRAPLLPPADTCHTELP